MIRSITNYYNSLGPLACGVIVTAGLVTAPAPAVDMGVTPFVAAAVQLQVSAAALSILAGATESSTLVHDTYSVFYDPSTDPVESPLSQAEGDTESPATTAVDPLSLPARDTDISGATDPSWTTDDGWTTDISETAVTRSLPEALLNVALSFVTMVVLAPINIVLSPLALLIPLALPLLDTSSCRYVVCAIAPLFVVGMIGAVTIGPAMGFLGSLYELWNTVFPPAVPASASMPPRAAVEQDAVSTAVATPTDVAEADAGVRESSQTRRPVHVAVGTHDRVEALTSPESPAIAITDPRGTALAETPSPSRVAASQATAPGDILVEGSPADRPTKSEATRSTKPRGASPSREKRTPSEVETASQEDPSTA